MKRKNYETPTMKVVELQHVAQLLSDSKREVSSGGTLSNGWNDSSGNAWDGSSSSSDGGGGTLGGGWTDSGGNPWE